jgi:hypothetical protein
MSAFVSCPLRAGPSAKRRCLARLEASTRLQRLAPAVTRDA